MLQRTPRAIPRRQGVQREHDQSRVGPAAATSVARAPDPTSIAGQAGQAIGTPVSEQALQANATMVGGQTISNADGNWVHTVGDTQIFVRVTNSRLVVGFTPQIVITANSGHWFVPNPDINLTEVWFDFKTGAFGQKMSAPDYAEKLGGASEKVHASLGTLFAKMPARMRGGNYDPFGDPQLVSDLQTMANGMSAGGGGSAVPRINNAALTAEVVLAKELSRPMGGASVTLPAGTRIQLSIHPAGDVPTSGADFAKLKIDSIQAILSNNASVNLRVLDVDLPVVSVSSAVLSQGGSLHLNYILINESLVFAYRELVRAGVAPGTLEDATRDPRSPKSHAIVDAAIRKHLDPLIQQAILTNKSVIPGLDLARALGVAP